MRDINGLLDQALLAATEAGESPAQITVAWLQERNALKQLLRANLHQKQYCEQVEKVCAAESRPRLPRRALRHSNFWRHIAFHACRWLKRTHLQAVAAAVPSRVWPRDADSLGKQ